MNHIDEPLCSMLAFLQLDANKQIEYIGSMIPHNAYDWQQAARISDEARYENYHRKQMGHPLSRFYHEYQSYQSLFMASENCPLITEELILEEIECLLRLMTFSERHSFSYNEFWSQERLHKAFEWKWLRRLSKQAMTKIGWFSHQPTLAFETLLWTS